MHNNLYIISGLVVGMVLMIASSFLKGKNQEERKRFVKEELISIFTNLFFMFCLLVLLAEYLVENYKPSIPWYVIQYSPITVGVMVALYIGFRIKSGNLSRLWSKFGGGRTVISRDDSAVAFYGILSIWAIVAVMLFIKAYMLGL